VAFALAVVVASGNWIAVARGLDRLEAITKPLTMVVLFVAVATLDPASATQRTVWLVALVLCLAGDVFLLLAHRRDHLFVPGLVSFLFGHVAYIVGFVIRGVHPPALVLGLVVVMVAVAAVGRPIVLAVGDREPKMSVPVIAYLVVISTMVVAAVGTWSLWAIVGAALFYGSDATIAWTRFRHDIPHGRVVIMVTYHLGQLALAASLI
jgi:uncharacterized membrane protein YhhN